LSKQRRNASRLEANGRQSRHGNGVGLESFLAQSFTNNLYFNSYSLSKTSAQRDNCHMPQVSVTSTRLIISLCELMRSEKAN